MTVDEYYKWFRAAGFEPTGQGTNLTEEWVNKSTGTKIIITRPNHLSPGDRIAAIGRYRMYLGIDYPPYGHGVH